MSDDNNSILSHVESSRRGFVKSVLAGAAFAAPVIASFSIESLGVDSAYGQSATSSAISATGSHGPCLPDLGYVGPAVFQAFVLDVSGNTRVNGELTITVQEQGDVAFFQLQMTKDADASSLNLKINGVTAANVALQAKNDFGRVSYQGRITTANLVGLCDFDSLLQALASQTGTAMVGGTYSLVSFCAQGSVVPVPGPTIQPRGW